MRSIDSAELDQSVTKRSLSDGQVAYLNIIRALAAELVLIAHAFLYFHADSDVYLNAERILGTLGVVLFFLISGFLISRSAFTNARRGSYTLSDYIIERFARIYTAFLPALVSIAIIDYFLIHYSAFPNTAGYNYWTFLGNLFMVRGFPVLEILHHSGCDSCWYIGDFSSARTFWTLPIEWWIYVTFGIIFFSIKDRYWTRLRLIVLGLASLYPLYHFIARFSGNLTGVWMMGLGASALYYWVETAQIDKSSDRPWILRIALFLMVLAVPMGLARLAFAQFNAYDMAFTTLLAIMVFAPLFVLKLHPVRLSKILRLTAHHLASYSYTLYLIHTTLMIAVVTLHREWITDTTDLILLLIAINLISFCFAHVFELHYHDVARYLKALFRSEEAVRRSKPRAQVVLPADALTAPDLKPSPIAAVALWDGSQESKSGSSFTRRTET